MRTIKKRILVIKTNPNRITFIDLYNEGSNIPLESRICQNQSQINLALEELTGSINNLQVKFKII